MSPSSFLRSFAMALCLVALSTFTVSAAEQPFAEQYAKAGVQSQNSFIWTDISVEQHFSPEIVNKKEYLVYIRPEIYNTSEAREPSNFFAVINKVSFVLLDKTEGTMEPTNTQLAKMMGYMFSSYFGPPMLKLESYDAARKVQHLRVVGYTVQDEQNQPFAIDFNVSMEEDEVEVLKHYMSRIAPAVVFELQGGLLRARYLDFYTTKEVQESLPSMDKIIRDGFKIDKTVDFRFGVRTATTYDSDMQAKRAAIEARRNAAARQALADRPKMRWYATYARFRDDSLACKAIRTDIERSHMMSGSTAQGQERTNEYAKRLAVGNPRCLK